MGTKPFPVMRPLFFTRQHPFPHRTWWIERFTNSEFVHVAVEVDGVVMQPVWNDGVRFYPWLAAKTTPGLAWSFEVPATRAMTLDRHESSRPKWLAEYVLRWLTRGLYRFPDCVTAVRAVLWDGGVFTPHSILTPADLFDHLRSEGYHLCSPIPDPKTSPTWC